MDHIASGDSGRNHGPLSTRKSDSELQVVDSSKPVRATLDHIPVDNDVESGCSHYLDVRSASEEVGVYGVCGGAVVGSSVR